ncbi:MAG: hypothetical protein HPY74_16915 [Firmicutes bacterium]|nr:hypothetical protein [Bacillota bacterium]
MSNKHRYISIELDKPRKLRFDLNALCELEDLFNKPLQQILNDGVSDVKTIRAFIWAGLLHEDPELTIKDVGHMIDLTNILQAQEKITEALNSGFGDDQGKNEEGPKAKENQSGTGKK